MKFLAAASDNIEFPQLADENGWDAAGIAKTLYDRSIL